MAGVRGGAKLKRWIRNTRNRAKQRVIEVGFRDARIAPLAAQLEFGNPATNLPERPAFRLGVIKMREEVRRWLIKTLRAGSQDGVGLTDAQAVELAILARDIIRETYMDFHGAPLSQRQIERKAGTAYADDQLIGAEGPKLVAHIKAYVDGAEVG